MLCAWRGQGGLVVVVGGQSLSLECVSTLKTRHSLHHPDQTEKTMRTSAAKHPDLPSQLHHRTLESRVPIFIFYMFTVRGQHEE